VVEKVVTPMQSLVDPTLLLESVESTNMVIPIQSSVYPTPLLGGAVHVDHVFSHPIQPMVEKVVTPMQSLVDLTLHLESVDSIKVVRPMQCLSYSTLLLGSDVSTDCVFSTSNSIHLEQGGIPLTLRTPPPSPGMVSFDWNYLVEPRLPSSTPF
jgi:hypothetical protein